MPNKKNGLVPVAVTAEIATILQAFGDVLCTPTIESRDGKYTVSMTFHGVSVEQELRVIECVERLQRVVDVATVRAFATHYNIDPDRLTPFIDGINE